MSLKQRVTITDIAQRSGASRTTVSLVLRDRPGISRETRDRVLAVAQELGYERRTSLPQRQETDFRTVAILFRARTRSHYDRSLGVNPFYSWVLTGMESVARTRRMNLIFGTLAVDDHNTILDAPDHLLSQDLDGVVIIGAFTEDTVCRVVGGATYPVVVVDAPAVPQKFDVIASDNVGGARTAVAYLVERGHQHIALITPRDGNPNFSDRARGYEEAIRLAGLRPVVGTLRNDEFTAAIEDALDQDPAVTAIFVVNDTFAVRIVKAAVGLGYEVPRTMAVIGFDDTDHAANSVPPLTTMRVDKVGMGRHAVLQVANRLTWPEGASTMRVLSPQLLERDSVAPPPATPGPWHPSRATLREGG